MAADSNRVLLTGGSGFIGRHLVPELLDHGYSLKLLLRSSNKLEQLNSDRVQPYTGDIGNPESLQQACARCDYAINLAGLAHVNSSDWSQLETVNAKGPLNLFQVAEQAGVQRFIHISSSLAAEAEAGRDDSAYAVSKLAAEHALLAAAKNSQTKLTIIRPVNVYGPGMTGNLASFIRLLNRHRLPRLPRGSSSMSLVGVEDLVRCIRLALEQQENTGSVFTVTDGIVYSLGELEAAIYRASGRKLPAWHIPAVVLYAALSGVVLLRKIGLVDSGISLRTYRNLVNDRVYSNSDACEQLGFTPGTSFYRELPRILDAMNQQGAH